MKFKGFERIFGKGLPPDTKIETEAIVSERQRIVNLKNQSVNNMKVFHISDTLPELNFTDADDLGFVSYKGLKVKNLTTMSLESEGITILKIKAPKDIVMDLHHHDLQAQLITVQKGAIVDLQYNMTFTKSKSYFVPPKDVHNIKYLAGTETIIYYAPKLKEIKHEKK